MKPKPIFLFLVAVMITSQIMNAQSSGNAVVDQLLAAWSPRNFTSEAVTDQQLDLILQCGIKAPSARNNQPWRFSHNEGDYRQCRSGKRTYTYLGCRIKGWGHS
ncbi:MAG: nitroreductase family protein [Bacteroidales bacterium]|nr:nitroreductase family protein [Bacteroidales bacterium]